MKNGLYYTKGKWDIGNEQYHMYIVIGQRSRGKNAVWLYEAAKRAIELGIGHRFVFLRRSDKQLELATELTNMFDPCYNVPEQAEFWTQYPTCKVSAHCIYLVDTDGKPHLVGYTRSLNNTKGASLSDCDTIIFDEIVEPARYLYKGGEGGSQEPLLFARLCETIFRRREFWAILLGNEDSPTNPYQDFFHIPYTHDTWKDKRVGKWFEFDMSEETAEQKQQSTIGSLFGNTQYMDYSNGVRAMGEVAEELICKRPAHARQLFNIKIGGKMYAEYFDDNNGVAYIDSTSAYNAALPLISVSAADMCVDSSFLQYNTTFQQIQRQLYGRGAVRFDTQQTATAYLSMLAIQ